MRTRSSLAALALLLGLALAPRPGGADEAELARARALFLTYCATCHGEEGDGQGPVGKLLETPPRNFRVGDFRYGGTDQDLFEVITNGAASKGGSPLMAPWGAVIPEADRRALVAYLRTLKQH